MDKLFICNLLRNKAKKYRSIYTEAEVSFSQMEKDSNFCVYLIIQDSYYSLVMYESASVLSGVEGYTVNINSIYAFGEIEKIESNPFGCWSVKKSVAKKGYGPFLYNCLLSLADEEGLTPDRNTITSSADKIWEYYFNNLKQNFFAILPIDNIRNPETSDKKSYGYIHNPKKNYANRSYIDHVYYFNKSAIYIKVIKKLIENHKTFIKLQPYNFFEKELLEVSKIFFEKRYYDAE